MNGIYDRNGIYVRNDCDVTNDYNFINVTLVFNISDVLNVINGAIFSLQPEGGVYSFDDVSVVHLL